MPPKGDQWGRNASRAAKASIQEEQANAGKKPAPKLEWEACLAFSDFKHLDPSDIDLRTVLSQIEKRHGSILRLDEVTSTLHIKATDEIQGEASVSAIHFVLGAMKEARDLAVWHPWVVIRLSDQVQDGAKIHVEREHNGNGGRAKLLTPSDHLIELSPPRKDHRNELKGILDTVVKGIRATPRAMQMRVHFGAIKLLKVEDINKGLYTLPEFRALVHWAVPRAVTFDTLMHHTPTLSVDGLRQRLGKLTDIDPCDLELSLVFRTRSLNIESKLGQTMGMGNRHKGIDKTVEYSFGPVQATSREKLNRSVELMNMCPDSQFDWELEIQDMPELRIPFDHEALRRSVKFMGGTWASGFPPFKVDNAFIKTHQIDLDNTIGKKTWKHPLSSDYNVEITTYHPWDKGALGPSMGFGVSLYADEWDVKTGGADIVSDRISWSDFESVFLPTASELEMPKSSGESDGYFDFLSWVHRVLKKVLREKTEATDSGVAGEKTGVTDRGVAGEKTGEKTEVADSVTDSVADSVADSDTLLSGAASVQPSLLDDDATESTDLAGDDGVWTEVVGKRRR